MLVKLTCVQMYTWCTKPVVAVQSYIQVNAVVCVQLYTLCTKRLVPVSCGVKDRQVICVCKFLGNRRWQIVRIDVEQEGGQAEPCGTPFLRRRNLLWGPLPVVRVKL